MFSKQHVITRQRQPVPGSSGVSAFLFVYVFSCGMSGKSDQANINACIMDFLHEPCDNTVGPLDLLFNDLPKGGPIPPFSIGYSIGMTKGVAAMAIMYAVLKLKLEDPEVQTIQAELVALLAMRATCDPAADIEA